MYQICCQRDLNVNYALVTPPAQEPIPEEDFEILKTHLRVDTQDDDILLHAYVAAARSYLEKMTNTMLMTQTWDMFLDYFPAEIEIQKRPVANVVSVSYYDTDNALQVLSPTAYDLDPNALYPKLRAASGTTWPAIKNRYGAVIIRFSGGTDDTRRIDPCLSQALKLHVAHLYANREEVSPDKVLQRIPLGYQALVGTERVIPI